MQSTHSLLEESFPSSEALDEGGPRAERLCPPLSLIVCPGTETSRKPNCSWDSSLKLFCPITEDYISPLPLGTHSNDRGFLARSRLPELGSAE